MTDDEMWRAAITAASLPALGLLIQQAKAYLRRARDKEGAGLPERIGKRAGKLWALANRRHK